ncbi:MAG: cytochrome c [Lewinellaceae bacterium]|nr:cytochrome c [Lewinellaceae bacterium]
MKSIKNIFFILVAVVVLHSCSPAGGNSAGHEYMPDMAHQVAYEANTYYTYSHNSWDEESTISRRDLSQPRLPVNGTVPRGYAGLFFAGDGAADQEKALLHGGNQINAIAVPVNGYVPFYYANNEDERTRASNDIQANPFPITQKGLEQGKLLYDINCGICHGEKGDGAGYLVRDPNPAAGDPGGVYPAAPANFLLDTFLNSSNGRYYYAIMYGKNVMGGYADKLSYEERWEVIHYIRALQAAEKKLVYSPDANTFNPVYGTPAKQMERLAAAAPVTDAAPPAGPAANHGQGGNH